MKNYLENVAEGHVWTIDEANYTAKNGFSICDYTEADLTRVRHAHTYIQIYFIDEGCLLHQVEKKEVLLSQGDLFLISPNVFHKLRQVGQNPVLYTAVNFEPDFLRNETADSGLFPSFVSFIANREIASVYPKISIESGALFKIMRIVEEMREEFGNQAEGSFAYIRGLLVQLLVLLARNYVKAPDHKSSLEVFQSYRETIGKCQEYIGANFTKELHLEDLTRDFTISRTNFCKYFKRYVGTSFNRYLNSLRINYAKDLLRLSNLSVSEIAVMSGYPDVAGFSHKFKSLTGISPGAYRKSR